MKINELFDIISEKENHTFIEDEFYEQSTAIKIPDNDGNKVDVVGMIIKTDNIATLLFDDKSFIMTGYKHVMLDSNSNPQNVYDLREGDGIYNSNGNKTIEKIIIGEQSTVYDLSINTKNHLYQDMEGFVHHNTYTVTTKIKEMLGVQGQKWVLIKGKASPLGLYSSLFIHRDQLIVFDDIDSVFTNKDTILMLKAALDSYDTRTISWISPRTIDVSRLNIGQKEELYTKIEDTLSTDPSSTKLKYPNSFDFTGRVIFISNIPAEKIDSAIRSRSFVIDISLNAKDVFKRMKSILPSIAPDASIADKEEVFGYIENQSSMDKADVNIRTLLNAIKCKQSGSPRWKHLAENYA